MAYINAGVYDKAIQDFDVLVQENIASDSTFLNRAVANYNMGNTETAKKGLRKALTINPNNQLAPENLNKIP